MLSLFLFTFSKVLLKEKIKYPVIQGIEVKAKQVLLVDLETFDPILEFNAHKLMHPSSMTKILTALVAFKAIQERTTSLDTFFTVSNSAWRREGTTMFLNSGQKVSVQDLLHGIVCASANDGCVTLAEGIAGSEFNYVILMNQFGKKIGLTNTNLTNTTGLPEESHKTTCWDLAKVSRFLIYRFPNFYSLFSQKEFSFNGINQFNKNRLLFKDARYDGIKTGFSSSAGYGMVASIYDPYKKRRLILIANGFSSETSRANEVHKIINWGLQSTKNVIFFEKYQTIKKMPLRYGQSKDFSVGTYQITGITINSTEPSPSYEIITPKTFYAPIRKGQQVGKIIIKTQTNTKEIPLIALETVKESNIIKKSFQKLMAFN